MSVVVNDSDFTLYCGDVREVLAGLPAESVHCCVTSPPYWGLRDYGATGQLGLEPTPEEYVANMVAVFREVRRVLRRDGTCWLNIGDSYAGGKTGRADGELMGSGGFGGGPIDSKYTGEPSAGRPVPPGLKQKDLVGIPWRLAFALQADGWCLRSDVIWSKPNPMPESVTDRPTKAHEYLFLLTPCQWSGGIEPWPMTREEAIWLAALVDGEGTICFQESPRKEWAPHISPRLSIVNTNRALLERVAEITNIGEGTTPSPRQRGDGSPGRPIFTWQLTNEKATRIIAAIRPHLIAKRTQAELAIYVQSLNDKHKGRGGHRTTDADLELKWKASAACSALNHGEDVDLGWFKPVRSGRWLTPKNTFYDADAIREAQLTPAVGLEGRTPPPNKGEGRGLTRAGNRTADGWIPNGYNNPAGRNKRSVWEIATEPYPDAHFATFPQALVEPCVLAGTSERGCCPVCGAPWEREVEVESSWRSRSEHGAIRGNLAPEGLVGAGTQRSVHGAGVSHDLDSRRRELKGWRPTCKCAGDVGEHAVSGSGLHEGLNPSIPCTVLDPFMGSGTTALVARRHGRKSIGIELNVEYAALAAKRTRQLSLLAGVAE